ncbi:MAG: creatininase family protein [Planctomycetota bacterium]|jgi:creatinine amidohydrolase
MKKVKYEDMVLHELESAIEENPIAYIPCGLLEWHSSHLPLGVDGLKIEELCRRIAVKYGGVVLPPFYVGAPGYTSFAGTLTYRPETVTQVFIETFDQLIKVGFKVIVAIGGHYGPPQESSLRTAGAKFKDLNNVKIWILNEADVVNDVGIYGDHAGVWETSMGIELCGDLVDLETFVPGQQELKQYKIPVREDGFDFEYNMTEFIIEEDLKTCLDPEKIKKQVALVADRIGSQALNLLSEVST